MFRKMRRWKQQLTDAKAKEILKITKRGVLSVLGDDGYRDSSRQGCEVC